MPEAAAHAAPALAAAVRALGAVRPAIFPSTGRRSMTTTPLATPPPTSPGKTQPPTASLHDDQPGGLAGAPPHHGPTAEKPITLIYERFEQVVSAVLAVLLSTLVAVTLIHLTLRVGNLLLFNMADAAQPEVFQAAFGTVMTVLIALEFNHTILSAFKGQHSVVQVRTVVLIALLALVRKFILLDVEKESPVMVLGLAASVLALGTVYWLVHEQERRDRPAPPSQRET
jgi:uncharacterized membrane protein (DUF373 family)